MRFESPAPWIVSRREAVLTVAGELIGELVVLDMSSLYVYLGRFVGEQGGFLILDDVDAHDLRDTSTSRERYLLDSRQHGIRPNRRRVWVRLADVTGISRLEDVLFD